VSDVGERMNGGAVKDDKSPENEAILINAHENRRGGTSAGPLRKIKGAFERTISERMSRILVGLLVQPVCAVRESGVKYQLKAAVLTLRLRGEHSLRLLVRDSMWVLRYQTLSRRSIVVDCGVREREKERWRWRGEWKR
jgi:hypothetical protein